MKNLREKSEKELALQAEHLAEICRLLENYSCLPLLIYGTLLGIRRSGDFIPWDWDTDLFVLYKDINNYSDSLIGEFIDSGFELVEFMSKKENWKIVIKKDKLSFDIMAWYEEGEFYKRKRYKIPKKFFKETAEVKLRGKKFKAPGRIEDYLSYVYGNWREEIKTSDRNIYLTGNHYSGRKSKVTLFRRKIKEKIKNVFSKKE